jgi:hypothetical protein
MRIPYNDLSRPKAAAKHLSALANGPKLSVVQETVARASGYRDWHDLTREVSAANVTHPSAGEFDIQVIEHLSDALGLDDSDVQQIVARTKLTDGKTWTEARHRSCRDALRQKRGGLTKVQIERGKAASRYHLPPHHEHDDCIRMAYEWLDAQVKIKGRTNKTRPIKHIIEKWAGRYISTTDVVVAAQIHPDIHGTYPHFNISARLTEPSAHRLEGIGEAFKHDYRQNFDPRIYDRREA